MEKFMNYRALTVLELFKQGIKQYESFYSILEPFIIEILNNEDWKYIYENISKSENLDDFLKKIKETKKSLFKSDLELEEILERKFLVSSSKPKKIAKKLKGGTL